MSQLDVVSRANGEYVDALYRRYLEDPGAVDERWALFFAGFDLAAGNHRRNLPAAAAEEIAASLRGAELPRPAATGATLGPRPPGIFDIVHSFRELGHYIARLDPLGSSPDRHPILAEAEARFTERDLDREIEAGSLMKGGPERLRIRDLITRLRGAYCGTIGVQYMEIPDKAQREWLQERIEPTLNRPELTREDRLATLKQLVAAEEFEQFLHARFVGHKRFSLEGSESLIPILETVIDESAELGVRELIIGMAHRGRLNVLAHTLRKPLELLMAEFEGVFLPDDVPGDGDVKYHLGYSHDHNTRRGKDIHLSLSPNPSHLEHVDPVIEGIVRAKQDRRGDAERRSVVPLVIHGDAAFTGQGIVAETLALSELDAYETGGTIHVIIDNRVAFTASPRDYRFTPYASDLARLINAPVFHVNGDDPESAIQAARLASAFRQRFRKDVIVDIICYRRHGHNELDEPTFTQPVMYKQIAAHPTTRKLYEQRLLAEGVLTSEEAAAITAEARQRLDDALALARKTRPRQAILTLGGAWKGLTRAGLDWSADTRVPRPVLERIARGCTQVPAGFTVHPKLRRLLDTRVRAVAPDGRIDWATAEMLAFGSLLLEGTRIRIAGQDVGRGTFGHRHAVLHDFETGRRHVPLDNLDPAQARFSAIDTMLSEAAVLGFEFGYSWADPWTLTLWEAQFGDFANVAQAMIDVFIAACESKWQRMSGLVMLLPHGYEGQGPEHSSARLERFLQLCAEDNLQVVNLTTPAQYFHALRRQIRRTFRKPLIVMSPKSLLRHELATSSLDELAEGRFEPVKDDLTPLDRANVRRVVFTSGKIYYTLRKAREERGIKDVALVRIEQLYPFPAAEITAALASYPAKADLLWVQEEAWNMGAWHFMRARFGTLLPERLLRYVGRDEAASPATGSSKIHPKEEDALVNEALQA